MNTDTNRRNGTFYKETRDMPVKEVAALIRSSIRTMAKNEMIQSAWNYSVRYKTAAAWEGIDIVISVPKSVMELKWKFEDHLFQLGKHEWYDLHTDLMTGEYEPLKHLLTTETLIKQLHDDFNFYEGPSHPMEDGCSTKFGGHVSFRYLD